MRCVYTCSFLILHHASSEGVPLRLGDKMPINQEKLIKLQQQKEKAQIGGKVKLWESE